MIPAEAHLDPRFKQFPNLQEDEYESILAVPILIRGEELEGALNVRTRAARAFEPAEIDLLVAIASQVAQTIEHAKLYESAQRRVHELEALARISEAVSESLYLEESLEAIVRTTMDSLGATGAALVLDDGRIAWPEGRPGAYAVRLPLRWKRRQIGELVCDRDTPFTPEDEALLEAIAHHAAVALEHGRAVLRGVLAQEIHHRVKNNLQTVASLLRLQARAADVDPRKALADSVNRILAIAAVHEVLTEHREDDVDLGELIDRLRSMLVQGLGAAKAVESDLEPVSLAGQRATALALVFSELFQNALEHGRAVMRGVLAQEIHHRVKNNLQSVASLLRLQARAENVDARKSLNDSVNRILAIAAVHEVLTEHREDDVDLGELVDRLRAMLVQGLVAGKDVSAELAPVSLAGHRATALALVFTELFQNALEHGGDRVSIALAQRNGDVILRIADDGAGIEGDAAGTGLSIVRALVRDELRGELALENDGGLRAEVVFPA